MLLLPTIWKSCPQYRFRDYCRFCGEKGYKSCRSFSRSKDKSLDRIKWAIDRTHDMKSTVLCGPFHSAHANFSRYPPQEQEYQWSAEVLHAAGDYAAEANITLALEALNRFECYLCNTMEQFLIWFQRQTILVLKPCTIPIIQTSKKKNCRAIETIAPVLHHVHISENDRGTPGDGHVLWDETYSSLAKIKYQGWLTSKPFHVTTLILQMQLMYGANTPTRGILPRKALPLLSRCARLMD